MSLSVCMEKKLDNFILQVSFESERGTVGVLGPSGCGKSMTLKCIAGVEKPDRGRIVLNGRILFDSEKGIDLKPQQRKVGYLFQQYALFPNMTVEENILCGLQGEGEKRKRQEKLQEYLEKMDLVAERKKYPGEISGGQQQRTALARMLAGAPELLLLDEPFSALDSHLRLRMQVEMKTLLKEVGKEAVFVSHSRDEIYRMSEQLAIMEQGKVCGFGDTRRMFDKPYNKTCAELTGCKNIAEGKKAGTHCVEVPAWNMRFETDTEVPEEPFYLGIRAHSFDCNQNDNRTNVKITGCMEEPFEMIYTFRYQDMPGETPDIWWRIPKKDRLPAGTGGLEWTAKKEVCLGVAPNQIMLFPA